MNKNLYDFLATDLQFIKGVGPVLAGRLNDLLGGRRVLDFLLLPPRSVRSRGFVESVIDGVVGEIVTIPLRIDTHKKGGSGNRFNNRRAPTQVFGYDKLGGQVILQFFNTNFLDYWLEKLPVGSWRLVSGKLESSGDKFLINHPDFIEKIENSNKIPEFQAVYPLNEGLSQKTMASVRDKIFEGLTKIRSDETNEFFEALEKIHYPQKPEDLEPTNENLQRLAYSELLASQIAIALSREKRKAYDGPEREILKSDNNYFEKLKSILPFELTGAQKRVISEIESDMQNKVPMMRLVQGDVGSGKTVIALMAMLQAISIGGQGAMLAPTDTLAKQHFEKIKPLCDQLNVFCDILTGRDKGKVRHEKLVSLKSGRTKIIIGTHALFQDDVEYKNLTIAVIDEQHRFGVDQRSALVAKGKFVDLLALSATPIPRTLSMTMYGDMDISILDEKPIGRLPIKTTKISYDSLNQLTGRIKLQIDNGAKIFWVCPLVEESEVSDLMNVENRFTYLKSLFLGKVGLVHGKMSKEERDRTMTEFADPNSKIKILVATTVIEVGIDVPSASIMVIENAEKFGLSALHQLRGRVGRGSVQSYCILMYGNNVTETGLKRLEILCETDDGFAIAEQDLMMRGVGELMGTKQSGWIPYHFVDYREHRDLFKLANRNAVDLIEKDPILESQRGQLVRDLMWIFGKSDASGFIKN